MADRFITATLLCGCDVDVDTPDGVPIGVELVQCPAGCNVDDEPAGPYLVTWRQAIAVTVANLTVPAIEVEGELADVQLPGTPRVERPASPSGDSAGNHSAPPDLALPPTPNEPSYFTPGTPLVPGDVTTSPKTSDEWRAIAHSRGFAHSLLLVRARDLSTHHKLAKPHNLGDIDEVLTPLVMEWLDEHHPVKP